MHQVWEDSILLLTVSSLFCHDTELHQLHRNVVKRTLPPNWYPRTELWATTMKRKVVTIAPKTMKRNWDSVHCQECVSAASYNAWLNSTLAMRCSPNVRTGSSMLSDYVSNVCMSTFMQQPHVEFAMTIFYQRLMTQKRLRPQTLAMTLYYISSTTLELKGTKSYRPNSRYIYDLTKVGD